MAAGQIIGAKLGAHLAIKNGARLIRPVFLTVVLSTIVVLIYKTYSTSDFMSRFTEQYGMLPQLLVGMMLLIGAVVIYRKRGRSPE